MKTSKTLTLSSEMRGREGPNIFKNRPRSGVESRKKYHRNVALNNEEVSEGIWDVTGEVSAPGGFHGGGSPVSGAYPELGLEYWNHFYKNQCFRSRSVKKNGKDRKRRPVEKQNFLFKKE